MNIRIVFSDLDGTLVHYPQELQRYADIEQLNDGNFLVRYNNSGEERICLPLPSTTRGYSLISLETCRRINEIRQKGIYFVYITGARTVTFENRRSLLPLADFEVFENGGVITQQGKIDAEWQRNVFDFIGSTYSLQTPVEERQGSLWDAYRFLSQKGFQVRIYKKIISVCWFLKLGYVVRCKRVLDTVSFKTTTRQHGTCRGMETDRSGNPIQNECGSCFQFESIGCYSFGLWKGECCKIYFTKASFECYLCSISNG